MSFTPADRAGHSTHTLGRIQVARDVLTLLTKDVEVAHRINEGLTEAADNLGEKSSHYFLCNNHFAFFESCNSIKKTCFYTQFMHEL